MGHALGLGVLDCTGYMRRRVLCRDNDIYRYFCSNATNQYNTLVSDHPMDTNPGTAPYTLLMENDGGDGTRCGHWEQDNFNSTTTSELMTGYLRRDKQTSLSTVTVGGLLDIIGYTDVDFSQADPYPFPQTSNRLGAPTIEEQFNTNSIDFSQMKDIEPLGLHRWGAVVGDPEPKNYDQADLDHFLSKLQ